MEQVEEQSEHHFCVCCGQKTAKGSWEYCYRCKRKWEHIVSSCVNHSIPFDKAKEIATRYYPRRYRVIDDNTLAVLQDGRIVDIRVEDVPTAR
jgi:hypothetical protein